MPIAIATHDLLSLAQAASRLPGRPHPSTLFRWVKTGTRGQRLDVIYVGGRLYTSTQALEDFLRRLNGPAIVTPSLTAAAAKRQQATAAALATRHGLRVGAPV